jgi:hypothetical protein
VSLGAGSQDDDDALLEARIGTVTARRRVADGDNRSSCPRARPPHYSTTMRYVVTRSVLPLVKNPLEPPSPESCANPLESGAPLLGSSPANPQSCPSPPTIPSVEMPDPRPTSDNPASSEGNRRTIGEWFRKVTTKRSHNRTSRQTPSEALPQSGIPSHTEATPPYEKPSTMAYGKRTKVCVSLLIQGTEI